MRTWGSFSILQCTGQSYTVNDCPLGNTGCSRVVELSEVLECLPTSLLKTDLKLSRIVCVLQESCFDSFHVPKGEMWKVQDLHFVS